MTEHTIKWLEMLSVIKTQIMHIGKPNLTSERKLWACKLSPVSNEILVVMTAAGKYQPPAQQAIKIGNKVSGIIRKETSINT